MEIVVEEVWGSGITGGKFELSWDPDEAKATLGAKDTEPDADVPFAFEFPLECDFCWSKKRPAKESMSLGLECRNENLNSAWTSL